MVALRHLTLTTASLTAILLTASACKPKSQPDPRSEDPIVEVIPAHASQPGSHLVTGVVAAHVASDLGFRVSGKIIERLVDTGQQVTKGQVLMRLDPTDYVHAVTTQTGSVASLHARWEQAANDERRYRGLVATGAVSASVYDQVKATADSIRAQLDAATAQEKIARNQDDYALLRADADGVIMQTLAEPGHVVSAGQTVIQIAHAGPREAAVNLPEDLRPALGSSATARLYDGDVTVPAHLRQLSGTADPATRTFEARYVMEGQGADAPLGATVTILLPAQENGNTKLSVPVSAIDNEGAGSGIWTVNTHDTTVSFHPVRVSTIGEETAQILTDAALAPGALVVAAGGHELHAGEHVRLDGGKVAMQ